MATCEDPADKMSISPWSKKKLLSGMQGMFKEMSDNLAAKLTVDFKTAVGNLGERVGRNSESTDKICTDFVVMRKEHEQTESIILTKIDSLERNVGRLSSSSVPSDTSVNSRGFTSSIGSGPDIASDPRKVQFHTSRRSVRIWQVKGENDDELRRESLRFVREKLKVAHGDVNDAQIERIRRTKTAKKSKVKFEALITLDDRYTRDILVAHAKNLAPYIDEEAQPTAGLRIDYPPHLTSAYRTLEWYGAEIWRRQGKGTRRNIKFDDATEEIYIDICKPGESYWHRVSVDMADELRSKKSKEEAAKSRRALETERTTSNSNLVPLGSGGVGLTGGSLRKQLPLLG